MHLLMILRCHGSLAIVRPIEEWTDARGAITRKPTAQHEAISKRRTSLQATTMEPLSSAGSITASSLEVILSTSSVALLLTLHLQTVIWLVVAMAILFAIVRFLIRLFALKKLLPDDFAVAAALVVLLSLAIMYEYATPIMFELDRITKGLDPSTPEFLPRAAVFLKLQFAIIVLFWTSIWVVKVSFLLFYRTLFTGLREHMVGWWLATGFTTIAYLLCWAFQLGSCIPISDYFIFGE